MKPTALIALFLSWIGLAPTPDATPPPTPDPLELTNHPITTPQDWETHGRPRTFRLIESEMYGKAPAPPKEGISAVLVETGEGAGGGWIREQWDIRLTGTPSGPTVHVLIARPKNIQKDTLLPAFLGLNFQGNHTIHSDPEIRIPTALTYRNAAPSATPRGDKSNRWPIQQITEAGFALVTAYCGDIDPDTKSDANGLQSAFYQSGQTQPAPDEWGTIAAWTWGLSRILDMLCHHPHIDGENRVAVIGHSRLGKTALWTAASDPRFAMAISNNSGCGGAALSKRAQGETVARINQSFPHWFCRNFRKYGNNEKALPFDQHQLIALIAPRPVYVASASKDLWADPEGEYLALRGAEPIYALYADPGLPESRFPQPNIPLHGVRLAYHLREGKHDITPWDWTHYIEFAGLHLTPESP